MFYLDTFRLFRYKFTMTYRVTNTVLLKELISSLGNKGEARLEVGADISRTTIREMIRGACPSPVIRGKVAAFLKTPEERIFPLMETREA